MLLHHWAFSPLAKIIKSCLRAPDGLCEVPVSAAMGSFVPLSPNLPEATCCLTSPYWDYRMFKTRTVFSSCTSQLLFLAKHKTLSCSPASFQEIPQSAVTIFHTPLNYLSEIVRWQCSMDKKLSWSDWQSYWIQRRLVMLKRPMICSNLHSIWTREWHC